jgi:hypothetical protein
MTLAFYQEGIPVTDETDALNSLLESELRGNRRLWMMPFRREK